MSYFNKDFMQFFKDLAANNHKDWFDANRKRYETTVKEPFKSFVGDMISRVQKVDPAVQIEPKDAIFRINRDIRFSKDKTPYKTNVSAVITPGGRKDKVTPGLYFELNPENIRVYSGLYMLDTQQLHKVRSYIAANLDEFNKIINEKQFKKRYGEILGEKHKRVPKEFQEAYEKQPLIANKAFYCFAKLDPDEVLRDDFPELIMDYYKTVFPLKNYLTKALG